MLKKGTKLYSILTGTCPKCQEESMYRHKTSFYFGKLLKMQERCSHCGTIYKLEPSFFFGAMYVSYAVGIAFGVAAFTINYIFGGSITSGFIAIVAALCVFMPFIIRVSRNIWINIFIHYKKEQSEESQISI